MNYGQQELVNVRSHAIDLLARPEGWVDKRTVVKLDSVADARIAGAVRAEITAPPTYGYRSAGALMNRTQSLMGLRPVKHKRMYRVMRQQGCCCRNRLGVVIVAALTMAK